MHSGNTTNTIPKLDICETEMLDNLFKVTPNIYDKSQDLNPAPLNLVLRYVPYSHLEGGSCSDSDLHYLVDGTLCFFIHGYELLPMCLMSRKRKVLLSQC